MFLDLVPPNLSNLKNSFIAHMTRQRRIVKAGTVALVMLSIVKFGTNADNISIEYRSAIFTTSDDQAASAKLVTEEIQAKHFTPRGRCSFQSYLDSSSLPSLNSQQSNKIFLTLKCTSTSCQEYLPRSALATSKDTAS